MSRPLFVFLYQDQFTFTTSSVCRRGSRLVGGIRSNDCSSRSRNGEEYQATLSNSKIIMPPKTPLNKFRSGFRMKSNTFSHQVETLLNLYGKF